MKLAYTFHSLEALGDFIKKLPVNHTVVHVTLVEEGYWVLQVEQRKGG